MGSEMCIRDRDVDAELDDGIFVLIGNVDESSTSLRSWQIKSCDVAFVVHHVVFLKCCLCCSINLLEFSNRPVDDLKAVRQ